MELLRHLGEKLTANTDKVTDGLSSNSHDLHFTRVGNSPPAQVTGPRGKTVAVRQRKAEAVAER